MGNPTELAMVHIAYILQKLHFPIFLYIYMTAGNKLHARTFFLKLVGGFFI